MADVSQKARQEQVERNWEAFREKLPELVKSHQGKFALMRDGEVIDFFDTARDAHVAGTKIYPDGIFSIQEVVDGSADMGFFSHALSERHV